MRSILQEVCGIIRLLPAFIGGALVVWAGKASGDAR
jgi:hypothetical protein